MVPRGRRVRAAGAARPELFAGFERAQSVSVDAHKWLYLPKACGILLVREQEDLVASFGHEQGYLPHQRHELHAMDTTFEYSRPFRALKFWLAMRVHGAAAFAEAIERNLREAQLLYRTVSARDDFEVLGPPKLSVVAFRHAPAASTTSVRTTSGWPRRSRPTAASGCRAR